MIQTCLSFVFNFVCSRLHLFLAQSSSVAVNACLLLSLKSANYNTPERKHPQYQDPDPKRRLVPKKKVAEYLTVHVCVCYVSKLDIRVIHALVCMSLMEVSRLETFSFGKIGITGNRDFGFRHGRRRAVRETFDF